jgi:hypothetical protein
LIERFSEDIDLVVSREAVGLASFDDHAPATSRNEKEEQREAVQGACQPYVESKIFPFLRERVHKLGQLVEAAELMFDSEDKARQNMDFKYTSLIGGSGYLRPIVKIEPGALSDTEPTRKARITPYVGDALNDELPDLSFEVRAVAAERTFWEKVCLLHEETYKTGDVRDRLARHYYDLWCLDRKGVATRAIADGALFARVVAHRREFFPRAAEIQASLKPGSLRLVPAPDRLGAWQADYKDMSEAMFFGRPPGFEEVMASTASLEGRVNEVALP